MRIITNFNIIKQLLTIIFRDTFKPLADFKRFGKLFIKLNTFIFKIIKYFIVIKDINGLKGEYYYNPDPNLYIDFLQILFELYFKFNKYSIAFESIRGQQTIYILGNILYIKMLVV